MGQDVGDVVQARVVVMGVLVGVFVAMAMLVGVVMFVLMAMIVMVVMAVWMLVAMHMGVGCVQAFFFLAVYRYGYMGAGDAAFYRGRGGNLHPGQA